MNKKKNPDLIRNIHHLVRLNKTEQEQLLNRLREANDMKPTDFIREMIKNGNVKAPIHKSDRIETERLLVLLLEYRTDFKRISNLIKAHDPSLNHQIDLLVKSIQKVIDRL